MTRSLLVGAIRADYDITYIYNVIVYNSYGTNTQLLVYINIGPIYIYIYIYIYITST